MASNLWVLPEELGEDLAESEYAYEACQTASHLLWGLSGRKYSGIRTVTETYPALSQPAYTREVYASSILPVTIADVYNRDNRTENRIRLRGQPVQNIQSVENANGDVYSEDEYFLTDRKYLNLANSYTGDLTVVYTYGSRPPVAGRMAARRLAKEFTYLWSGSDECTLPSRVTSISRENVSWTLMDDQAFIDDLKTGIYEVDLFLKMTNPDRARRRAKVFSPDLRKAQRRHDEGPIAGYGTGGYGQ